MHARISRRVETKRFLKRNLDEQQLESQEGLKHNSRGSGQARPQQRPRISRRVETIVRQNQLIALKRHVNLESQEGLKLAKTS